MRLEIGKLQIIPRVAHRYPFDIVGLASLSKAFAIAKAGLKLLASDHPDEAYGLSRSLVECATNLRYLTVDRSELEPRARDFVKFAMADKAFWLHHALENAKSRKEKAELRDYAKQLGIADNTKRARQHRAGKGSGFVWYSTMLDHPIDGPTTASHRKKAYGWIIMKPPRLCIAQCRRLIVTTLITVSRFVFQLPLVILRRISQRCSSWCLYIHSSISYVFSGLNIDRPAKLDASFQRTLNNMKPVPTRHKSDRPT